MLLEPVRIITDWLKSDALTGVNAKLTAVPLDAGDTAPKPVAFFGDATRDDRVARMDDPPKAPAIYVHPDGPTNADGEIGTIYRDAKQVSVAIRLLVKNADTAEANAQVMYSLRAIAASVRDLFRNENYPSRVRNGIALQTITALTYGRVEETAGNHVAAGAVVVTIQVRDTRPDLGAIVPRLPPVRTPAFGVRADELTGAQTGVASVGGVALWLGCDPTAADANDPAAFDTSTGIRTVVFGRRGRVTFPPLPGGALTAIETALRDPSGFTIVAAIEPDFATELNVAGNRQVFALLSTSLFSTNLVSAYLATAAPRLNVRARADGLTQVNVLSSTNVTAGRRVVAWEYDPTQNTHFDKVNFYIDGVLCSKFANASTGAGAPLGPTEGACEAAWGHIVGAQGADPPIQRQFALYLWPGKLTAQEHADITAWFHAEGWV